MMKKSVCNKLIYIVLYMVIANTYSGCISLLEMKTPKQFNMGKYSYFQFNQSQETFLILRILMDKAFSKSTL